MRCTADTLVEGGGGFQPSPLAATFPWPSPKCACMPPACLMRPARLTQLAAGFFLSLDLRTAPVPEQWRAAGLSGRPQGHEREADDAGAMLPSPLSTLLNFCITLPCGL